MAKCFTAWTVLPHKPIEKLTDNLWSVEGTMPDGRTQRRMTVARLKDGRLAIHNGIALDEPEMKELEAFGTVAAIIVPNGFHRQDALIWKQRYPGAKVFCPHGATKRVKQVVAVDGSYDEAPQDDSVRFVHLEGAKKIEGVMEVKSAGGVSLVFNDMLMNMPRRGGLVGVMLAPTGRPSVPRVMRLLAMKDKKAFAGHLEQLAETRELARLIVGHGKTITEAPSDVLRSVARAL